MIDINGHNRLPNTVGLDVFFANFDFNGMLKAENGQLHSNPHLNDPCFGLNGYANGEACLNSIIKNNWEITYY